MLNPRIPLANRAQRGIAPTRAKQKALQTERAPAVGSQAIEHLRQGKFGDFKASHQGRGLDEILTAFRGPSSHVQHPLGNEAIHTIKEQLLLVREFDQEIQDFSVDQLKELMSRIKQVLNSSNQTSSNVQEKAICQLIAVANRAFAQFFNLKPYDVQILAVLGILTSRGDFKGCLAQIKTGEGKSTVVTLLALILACQGKCIDVITSTEYLSKRDERKYKPFFGFFDITTSHICTNAFTPDHFSGQIVYGTNYNFEFSVLFDKLYLKANRILYNNRSHSRPFHVAIVDEVDNMLLDKASNSARIAHQNQKSLTALYPVIYDYVEENCRAWKAPDMGTISACAHLVKQYELPEKQLREFIDNAYQACFKHKLDEHYCLRKPTEHSGHDENLEVVIIDRDTGRLSEKSRWQHGLHQFLEYKHGLPIQEETLTLGALSHPAFFSYYEEIYGVTGSLGADIERNEVTEIYGLTSFDVPTHKPSLLKKLPTIICHTEQEFNSTLLNEVLSEVKAGRPCLVLCNSIAKSHTLYQLIKPEVSDIQLLNDVQNEDEDFLVARAAHSGFVTVATNAAARGTDINVLRKAVENGGLAVRSTSFHLNERGEIQEIGRGDRQGKPSSYRLILPPDDELLLSIGSGKIEMLIALMGMMVEKESLTSIEYAAIHSLLSNNGGDKVEELKALRKGMVEKTSLIRRKRAAIHLAQHHVLESFCNEFQNKFATSINRHAILNEWAEFYTDLDKLEINLEHDFDAALLNYKNKLNSSYDHFMKSLAA